jgi:mannitol-specific phosphotransferase system IIBC component
MTSILSLMAPNKTGAVIEIIIMILLAGVIAFLTAYFYFKPIYLKNISALETDKKRLEDEAASLRSDISQLNEKILQLESKQKGGKNPAS